MHTALHWVNTCDFSAVNRVQNTVIVFQIPLLNQLFIF